MGTVNYSMLYKHHMEGYVAVTFAVTSMATTLGLGQ